MSIVTDICAYCGDKEGTVPFHVALSNQAVGVRERRSATLGIGGLACSRCSHRLGSFERLRNIAVVTLVVACLLLLVGLKETERSITLGLLMIAAAIIGVAATLTPVVRWHRRAVESLLSEDMQAELLRRLPELGGIIAWTQVRVFPGVMVDAIPIAELRARSSLHRRPRGD
jgi:uncharacterized membrane protein YbhN (UPF0104 family)